MKETKGKKINHWKGFVRFLIAKHPNTPLKQLLKNYSKEEYRNFKKKPRVYI